MMSILMAFAIEAWWEDRQDEIRRQGLIDAMKLEFQATQGRLESRIEYADSIIDGTVEFLKIDSHEQYSVEELGQLIQGIFQGILFQESLPAYESALSSGSLALIDSPQFFAAIARFYDALSFHKYVSDISGRIYFQGSTWELRRMLGSTEALSHRGAGNDVPERFRLTKSELREIFARSPIKMFVPR